MDSLYTRTGYRPYSQHWKIGGVCRTFTIPPSTRFSWKTPNIRHFRHLLIEGLGSCTAESRSVAFFKSKNYPYSGRLKSSPMFTSEGCTFLDLAFSPRDRSCDCDRSRGYSSLSARDRVTSHADGDRSMDCDRSRCMDRCRVDCDRSMDCDRARGGSTTCMACHPNMTLNIDRHCATPSRPSGKTPAGAPSEAVRRGRI